MAMEREDERLLLDDDGLQYAMQAMKTDPCLQDAGASIAVGKLKSLGFEGLDLADVQHLCKILGGSQEYIEYDRLKILLTVVLDPPLSIEDVETVWDLSEKRPDGKVSAEEFHRSMKIGNIMYKLSDLQKYTNKRRSFREAPLVNRDLFKTWVAWRNHRDDAFQTLPLAVISLLVFVLLVISHLQIAERQLQERALEDWVTGWSADWGGPYLHDHVQSVGYFYAWLAASGMPCLFQDARNDSAGYQFIHMASSSLIVGDARLIKVPDDADKEQKPAWLITSPTGRLKVQEHQGESDVFQKAAQAQLKELTSDGFFDYETEDMRLEWITYNHRTRMFCLNVIRVVFSGSGVIVPSMSSYAVLIELYPRRQMVWCISIWILSGLYCLLTIQPVWEEGKEMLFSMKVGLKGFINYWSFWNAVDWGTVLMGVAVIVLWTTCDQVIRCDSIQALIDDEFHLRPLAMELSHGQIQQIWDDLMLVSTVLLALHVVMAVSVITILLKLFKAFKSNARLSVITDTMKAAAVDIIHFLIVFSMIFLAFALIAHVLFGNDLEEFKSFGISIVTCFNVLIGDFGWYVDFQQSPGFGSGMPRALMTIWFLSYETVARLCVFNMFLAVIMERYEQVSGALEMSAEAPTLWVQVHRYFERRAATRGFIPLVSIMAALEVTGSKMVHPGDAVTSQSILEAFPDMKPEQANWLMRYLEKEVEAKSRQPQQNPGKDVEDMGNMQEKLDAMHGHMEQIAEKLRCVRMTAFLASRKMDTLEDQRQQPQPQASNEKPADDDVFTKFDSFMDKLGQQLQDNTLATAELRAMMKELPDSTQKLSARAIISEDKFNDSEHQPRRPRVLPCCCGTDSFMTPQSLSIRDTSSLPEDRLNNDVVVRSRGPKVLPPCWGTDFHSFQRWGQLPD